MKSKGTTEHRESEGAWLSPIASHLPLVIGLLLPTVIQCPQSLGQAEAWTQVQRGWKSGVHTSYTMLLDRPRGTWAALNSPCKYPCAQGSTMLKADKNHVTGQERDRGKKGKWFFLLFEETLWGFNPGVGPDEDLQGQEESSNKYGINEKGGFIGRNSSLNEHFWFVWEN